MPRPAPPSEAFWENRAKFVRRPSQVAPRGCGEPTESRALVFGNEKNCSKRWNDKGRLGAAPFWNVLVPTAFPAPAESAWAPSARPRLLASDEPARHAGIPENGAAERPQAG